jgi:FtsZ-binding cell division protein ZapB
MKRELMFSGPAFRKEKSGESISGRIGKIFSKEKIENDDKLTAAYVEIDELKEKLAKLKSGTKKDLMARIEELEAENESLKGGGNEYSTEE